MVEEFFLEQDTPTRRVMEYLHAMFTSQPGVYAQIRYRVPFFYRHSWICYMNPQKKGGMELCFLYGQLLSNEQGLLDKKDRKQVSGITIYRTEDMPAEAILEVFQEALILDEMMAEQKKKRKKGK
ncbi:MAG: DUF1801 domain-containing protein [Bacteroidota bacterium]